MEWLGKGTVWGSSPRMMLFIQVAAAGVMIWGAGVELRSLGDLVGLGPLASPSWRCP
jgi:hypothetical protein